MIAPAMPDSTLAQRLLDGDRRALAPRIVHAGGDEVVVTDLEQGAQYDPEFLKSLGGLATRVTVTEGTRTKVRVPIFLVTSFLRRISSYVFVRPRPVAAHASATVQLKRSRNGIRFDIPLSSRSRGGVSAWRRIWNNHRCLVWGFFVLQFGLHLTPNCFEVGERTAQYFIADCGFRGCAFDKTLK